MDRAQLFEQLIRSSELVNSTLPSIGVNDHEAFTEITSSLDEMRALSAKLSCNTKVAEAALDALDSIRKTALDETVSAEQRLADIITILATAAELMTGNATLTTTEEVAS